MPEVYRATKKLVIKIVGQRERKFITANGEGSNKKEN